MPRLQKHFEEASGLAAAALSLGGSWFAGFRPPVLGDVAFGMASTAAVIAVLWAGASFVRAASPARLKRTAIISAVVLLGALAGYFVEHLDLVRRDPLTTNTEGKVHGLWYTAEAETLCVRKSRDECIQLFGAQDNPWATVYPSSAVTAAQLLLTLLYTVSGVSLTILAMSLVAARRKDS